MGKESATELRSEIRRLLHDMDEMKERIDASTGGEYPQLSLSSDSPGRQFGEKGGRDNDVDDGYSDGDPPSVEDLTAQVRKMRRDIEASSILIGSVDDPASSPDARREGGPEARGRKLEERTLEVEALTVRCVEAEAEAAVLRTWKDRALDTILGTGGESEASSAGEAAPRGEREREDQSPDCPPQRPEVPRKSRKPRAITVKWKARLKQLRQFREQYGHCNVPDNYRDKTLLRWVKRQRFLFGVRIRKGNTTRGKEWKYDILSEEKMEILESLGFEWVASKNLTVPLDAVATGLGGGISSPRRSVGTLNEIKWEKRIQELQQFRAQYGHCSVSNLCPTNPSLGFWAMHQRHYYRNRARGESPSIRDERVEELNEMEFAWRIESG